MQINAFTVGPFAENTYLLSQQGQALLVDPGFLEASEFESFKNEIKTSDLTLLGVILTHAHVDHLLGLQKVIDEYDVPVYLSDKDRFLWQNYESQAQMFGFSANGFSFDPETLPIQTDWKIGPFTFDLLYTPGHSPDHVSLYNKDNEVVIAGDALFKLGIGRTDLYKGNFQLLEESIKEKLYSLPDNTVVHPGHGPETTIGYEKENNPFVRA